MPKLAIKSGKPVRKNPFSVYPVFGEEEIEAAIRVIKSGKLCSGVGNEAEKFEKEFANYHDVPFAIAVSNGTTGLHTALASSGIGVGDEVIVTPYTFLSTATCVLMQNAIPVFADIEPKTLGLDAQKVFNKITKRTKAIILVHMNGFPAVHLKEIKKLALKHKLILIEDCSHAHGAEFRGKKVGTFGDFGVFSFQQKKNLSVGEGGMLITTNNDLDEKAKAFRSFGAVPLAYNYRMTELHAAIGRVRLKRLDTENRQRIKNAGYLNQGLKGLRGIEVQIPYPGTKAVYYNYIIKYNEKELGVSRKDFISAIEAEGILIPQIYAPLYRHSTFQIRNAYNLGCPFTCPYYKAPGAEWPNYQDGSCPVAEETCDKRNIEIKIHPPAGKTEMEDIAVAFRKVVENITELRKTSVRWPKGRLQNINFN
ncbi:MAG: DegT/DnrJ/EryC1/StrS family aminotransferase [Candidatus Omnitrophota bacterium]